MRRPASTASRDDASRLKNQIPGFSPPAFTYVRTFSSRNDDTRGSGRRPRARSPLSRNGVIPSHATPSCVSTSSSGGTCLRTSAADTRQLAKSRSSQVWPISQPRRGIGHGLCSSRSSDRACRAAVSSWSMLVMCLPRRPLEIASERLLALDRLEERLEVAVAEAAGAVALDHLEKHGRTVLGSLREDLQQ